MSLNTLFVKENKIEQRQYIVLEKDGFCTINPTDEMLFADGWKLYVKPEPPQPTAEELLEKSKSDKKVEISNYDKSNYVNEFYVNGIPLWLDKATRTGLMLRFNAEIAMGKENTVLWYGNISIPLRLDDAVQMLYAIEVYASACYDVTQYHLSTIDTFETIEDVEMYDYMDGYPEKLSFDCNELFEDEMMSDSDLLEEIKEYGDSDLLDDLGSSDNGESD